MCTRAGAPGPRRVLVPRWRPLDAEEGKPVPVGSGDGIGNGRERLVSSTVPLESFHQCCDGMGGALPLPDHLGAGLNAAAAKHGVRITLPTRLATSPSPRFVSRRSPPHTPPRLCIPP